MAARHKSLAAGILFLVFIGWVHGAVGKTKLYCGRHISVLEDSIQFQIEVLMDGNQIPMGFGIELEFKDQRYEIKRNRNLIVCLETPCEFAQYRN